MEYIKNLELVESIRWVGKEGLRQLKDFWLEGLLRKEMSLRVKREKEYMPSLCVEEAAIIERKFWLTTNRAKW